jgi:hypothetical protein
MKSYFFLSGQDASDFSDEVLLGIQRAIKRNSSFIGLDLSSKYSFQMKPAKEQRGRWYLELLNAKMLTLRWANLPKRKAVILFEAILRADNPVDFICSEAKNWQPQTLYRHDDGTISGKPQSDGNADDSKQETLPDDDPNPPAAPGVIWDSTTGKGSIVLYQHDDGTLSD